ncbi:hypothetical protein C8F01DRAFT_1378227 [Mycena amicta]|nr:hypothetical protein C8F01DRAFT_1378227 [Mycena amicta]
MLHWKDFSACIMVDGKEAKEYDIETSEAENVVTCYIASQTGKEFTVLWENCSYLDDEQICGDVYLDGVYITGDARAAEFEEDLPQIVEALGAVCDDGKSIRPFVFSPLKLTDDDAFLETSSTELQDLGVIALCIYPVVGDEDDTPVSNDVLPKLTVHEKAKKGRTQQVLLGAPKALPDGGNFSSSVGTTRVGPDLVKFRFTYRPFEVLQASRIAPPPKSKKRTSPPGTSKEGKCADPDVDARKAKEREDAEVKARKAKQLREQLAAVESAALAEAKRIRDELDALECTSKTVVKSEESHIDLIQEQETGRKKKKVKREGGPGPAPAFLSCEVIDLT